MSSNGGANYGFGVGLAGAASTVVSQQGQGVAALLVMLAVLCFIFAYCCWGAPFCRSLCRRHCCCRLEDADSESASGYGAQGSARPSSAEQPVLATPTIILLPHGRMLVVDGTIFTQFQAENTGLDLVELGESVMRAQRNPGGGMVHQLQNSQGSIIEMDAETPSKDSMGSLGCFPPPTYESIYGKDEAGDMPPSYSDILLHRLANLPFEIEMQEYARGVDSKEEIELQSMENCPHIIGNPLSGLGYPYATAYSSQSLPRGGSGREPSLIGNPLDAYYVDNELTGLYASGRRRSLIAVQGAAASRRSRADHELALAAAATPVDEAANNQRPVERRESRTKADDRSDSESVADKRSSYRWKESRPRADSTTSRHSGRSVARGCNNEEDLEDAAEEQVIFARPRRPEVGVESSLARVHRESRGPPSERSERLEWYLENLDAGAALGAYEPEAEAAASGPVDEVCAEDDPDNFKALADIRESRV